ncbi:hypothetical protein LC605_00365 [Nostoc sp. CHAB 5836]|uniref:hypothetical protein n=1 Tax=Nostoc sp. CHAB 5836 TaxID=2780404 RepID=UPI001E36B93B|nr:hypothetical protein [Nostoc sp. CHAB 5836]MCC5613552.1 hypothetical protein [Nostoc sp. CHAB 5836]
MKKLFLQIPRLFVATVTGISFASLLMAQPSSAQVSPTDAFPSNNTTDENTDPFSRTNSDNFNMFDLIHRANFGNLNWNSDQQNEQLDSAAAAFKARQQKLIQGQQQQATPSSPSVTQPSVTLPLVTPSSGN